LTPIPSTLHETINQDNLMHEFTRSTPISLNISLPTGSVNVVAEERETVNVTVTPRGSSRQDREAAEATTVILSGDELTIEAPKGASYLRQSVQLKIEVQAPIDSDVRVGVASATVNCKGRYHEVVVKTASGDVEIEDATGDMKIQTASGDVQINSIGGSFSAKTASGAVTVNDVAGATTLRSASGKLEIAEAHTDVRSKSASGDLVIGVAHSGVISANSASGAVSVGVVPNAGVWLDLDSVSGSINSDLDRSDTKPDSVDLTIHATTTSGDIDILRAREKTTA
jgi:DUF4097 and DUF4098 domain-containing protein YvlB